MIELNKKIKCFKATPSFSKFKLASDTVTSLENVNRNSRKVIGDIDAMILYLNKMKSLYAGNEMAVGKLNTLINKYNALASDLRVKDREIERSVILCAKKIADNNEAYSGNAASIVKKIKREEI